MADLDNLSLPDVSAKALTRLKDRALSAAAEGITIADARLPDRPLIYVNAGFERLTGYPRQAVLGRNCRFLQGAGTDADTVTEIRNAIAQGRECTVEILNYRKDGTPFWNRLSITPVKDEAGDITHFIGIQSDVSARRRAEQDLRKAKVELEEALAELERDLDLASRIQQSLLPRTSPVLDGFEAAWRFLPCAHLAGDFLNVFQLDERHIALYVLDVSGHGASAALLSVTLSGWLSPIPRESCLFQPDAGAATGFRISPPAEVASYLNRRFRSTPGVSQYFTIAYAVLDIAERKVTYTAAGHPGPILLPRNSAPQMHSSTGIPIGMFPDARYGEAVVELQPGDRLYFYTDGVTEALDERDREFGKERFLGAVAAARARSLDDSLEEVVARVRDWQGSEVGNDDLSLLAAEID